MPIDDGGGVVGNMPHIAGTRIGVHHIWERVIHGTMSVEDIVTDEYPHLSESDVYEALKWGFDNPHTFERLQKEQAKAEKQAQDLAISSESELPEALRDS